MGDSADRPAHAVTPPRGRLRLGGVLAGMTAIAVAVAVAIPTLLSDPVPAAGTITTARSLTVAVPRAAIPLSGAELARLLRQPADLGGLGDPARLAACLSGLGYSTSTRVLGGRTVEINGRPAVVLLLPSDQPGVVNALAVAPRCSAADTGLVADTVMPTP